MALDQAYFDAIQIDIVKKKYYNANKVEAVFADIKSQAAALQAENELLRGQLEAMSGRKDEIGNAIICARELSQQIIADANEQAEQIIAQAQNRREELLHELLVSKESAQQRMDKYVRDMEQRRDEFNTVINTAWQDFLCSLYPEDDSDSSLLGDLPDKVSAIADAIKEINGD